MGYTHYYTQNRDFTPSEWEELTAVTRLALSHLPAHTNSAGGCYANYPLVICGGMGNGDPVIDDDAIVFNGDESTGMDHETFYLERDGRNFHFCKTARKPYDLLVCAVLLLATEIAPGALDVSSDGDMAGEEWQPAREFIRGMTTAPAKEKYYAF